MQMQDQSHSNQQSERFSSPQLSLPMRAPTLHDVLAVLPIYARVFSIHAIIILIFFFLNLVIEESCNTDIHKLQR